MNKYAINFVVLIFTVLILALHGGKVYGQQPPPDGVACKGLPATKVGTPGNDNINGTPGRDVIHGLGGDDTIRGLGGDDVICGGAGNDTLYGNSGSDRLFGRRGNDKLFGRAGADFLFGQQGNDALNGGAGPDSCTGGPGTDTTVLCAQASAGAGDSVPPTITTGVTPTPNGAGWNNTDVAVSFSCSDAASGIEVCPEPVTLSSEGAGQVVTGTARDRAGNTAEASVTVNIDKTPPELAITSPSPGTTVTTPSLTVNGTVSDALSGIASVTCNGTAASVDAGNFTCGLTLKLGENTLTVLATDVAGNSSTTDINVSLVQDLDDIPLAGLQQFLRDNNIDSAAKFLERLPDEYKDHWIMITAMESAQKSTAKEPRVIAPSADAKKVFAFCTGKPCRIDKGDTVDVIEYIQFDETTNKFNFIDISLSEGKPAEVEVNPTLCNSCHGQNLRPNWDTYDSWANMLPFNRDRIYKGSQEEEAFIRLLEHLEGDPIIGQLKRPEGVTPESGTPITIMPDDNDPGGEKIVTFTKKDGLPNYTGCIPMITDPNCIKVPVKEGEFLKQGGEFLTLHHSVKGLTSDEGRGVALFDQLSRYNARRVAQELLDFQNSMMNTKNVDIRPIALAIVSTDDQGRACVREDNLGDFASDEALAFLKEKHGNKDFATLLEETINARRSLPQRKANRQAMNLKGLIEANNEGPPAPPDPFATEVEPTAENITMEIARRSQEGFDLDVLTKFMIDREDNLDTDIDNTIVALFRFFLEPWGVLVEGWSMSVPASSGTYTFADVFSLYKSEIQSRMRMKEVLGDKTCDELKTLSKCAFNRALGLSTDGCPLAFAAASAPLVSPQLPDLVVETIGCDAAALDFRTSNVGTGWADSFRNKIIFISRATRQQVGYPTIPEVGERALVLRPGEWTDLSAAVPAECLVRDVPPEQQGCDVLIFADSEGTVEEPDDVNNMARGLCAP